MVKNNLGKSIMIEKEHPKLSITQQCILLRFTRSNLYYQPIGESEENLQMMRFLDEQYFKTPFYGTRKLHQLLLNKGYIVNKKRVKRLMQLINWQTIYRAPNMSKANIGNKVYPYLLRGTSIERKNQVWSTDITYIPMHRGFVYLCAIIDVHTRFALTWSISNTMTAEWCQAIMEEAVNQYSKPEIVNTDQGSQFTSQVFTQYLLDNNIQISMDGKGRAIDNIWIERLWRSVKYEDVYIKSYNTVTELHNGLNQYFRFYNHERIHETLSYKTPEWMYRTAA